VRLAATSDQENAPGKQQRGAGLPPGRSHLQGAALLRHASLWRALAGRRGSRRARALSAAVEAVLEALQASAGGCAIGCVKAEAVGDLIGPVSRLGLANGGVG
jgi:hypothetical protein